MTDQELRVLDAEVASTVMGIQPIKQCEYFMEVFTCERQWLEEGDYYTADVSDKGHLFNYERIPSFSSDMNATWEVVRKVRDLPDGYKYNLSLLEYTYNRTYATFYPGGLDGDEDWMGEGNGEHCSSIAICQAALKAIAMISPSVPASAQ